MLEPSNINTGTNFEILNFCIVLVISNHPFLIMVLSVSFYAVSCKSYWSENKKVIYNKNKFDIFFNESCIERLMSLFDWVVK